MMPKSNTRKGNARGLCNIQNDTTSSLALLFRLIEANEWNKLYKLFLNEPERCKTFQYLAQHVANDSCYNGMTILHAVARFDAPDIVQRIVELCPDAPAARDIFNRTPLHVAAGTSAGSFVIRFLVDAYPEACMIQDADGRTPLHMACDTSTELFEDNARGIMLGQEPPPCYRSILFLLRASLQSAILEDADETSAIEYALCSNANLKTVRALQMAAQKARNQEYGAERKDSGRQRRVPIEKVAKRFGALRISRVRSTTAA